MGRKSGLIALAFVLAACGGSAPQNNETTAQVVSTQSIPASMRGVEAKQLVGAKPRGSQQTPRP